MSKDDKVVRLFDTDPKADKFWRKLNNVVNKHTHGLSYSEIVGMLEFVKQRIIDEYKEGD